jgi:hypothetical protein
MQTSQSPGGAKDGFSIPCIFEAVTHAGGVVIFAPLREVSRGRVKESFAPAMETAPERKPEMTPATRYAALALLATVLVASAVLFFSVKRTVFYHDESGWIASGYFYSDLLLHHPFDWNRWNDPGYGPWGSLNPQLGKWLIGFPLVAYYRFTGRQPFMELYDETRPYGENLRGGKIPTSEVLYLGRTVSAVFGLACVILVFVIGGLSYNYRVGTLAAFLVFSNKTFRLASTRAMTDVYLNLFLLLFLLSLILFQGRNGSKTWLFLSGVFAGCACSIKITGLPICGLIFLSFLIFRMMQERGTWRALLKPVAAFSLAALMTIYLLNPFFWPSFGGFEFKAAIQELTAVAGKRIHLSEQARLPERYQSQYPQLWNVSHPLEFPLLYLRWNKFMDRLSNGQAGAPMKFRELWQRNRVVDLNKMLFMEYASLTSVANTVAGRSSFVTYFLGSVELLFLFLGAAVCMPGGARVRLRQPARDYCIPLIYFAVNYLFIVCLLTINFDRYYLPAIIASKFLVALGAWGTVDWIRRSRRPPSARDLRENLH